MNLGNCFGELKDYEKAISSFLKVISYVPDYSDAYINMGEVYNRTGEKQLAFYNFKKAVTLDSTNIHGHYNLGVEHFHQKNYEQSLWHLLKVLKLCKSEMQAKNEFDLFYKLSVLYGELGNLSKKEEYEILAKKFSSK
jgi:tetratricopeptide (TPR) repeat protein